MPTKSLISWFIVGFINVSSALASAPSCDPDVQPATIDPVFKLDLPASFYATHFSVAPLPLLQQCGVTAGHGNYDYKYWVFASASQGAERYVILGGMWRDEAGSSNSARAKPRVWVPDRFGSLDKISAGKCVAISWPLDVFCTAASGPPGIAVLQELSLDAVRRYVIAYGSRARFIAALRQQDRVPNGAGLEILSGSIGQAR